MTIGLRRQPLGKQSIPEGPAADGAQHRFPHGAAGGLLGGIVDGNALRCLLQTIHHGAGTDLYPLLFQDQRQILAQLPIHIGQQPVHALQQGDAAPQIAVKRGKLHADDAPADDDDGAVQVIRPLQQFIGGHGQLQPRNGGPHRHGAGGDQDAPGLIVAAVLAGDTDASRRRDDGPAPQQRHACALQKALDPAAQLSGDALLIGEDLRDVRPQTLCVDADGGAVCGAAVDLRSMEQRLGGDAPPVQAGAAPARGSSTMAVESPSLAARAAAV